jgi:N-methylhydantoinase A
MTNARGQRGTGRLAVDIGGTFTDVAVQAGRRYFTAKVPTTPASPAAGAREAIAAALDRAGLAACEVGTVVHGTTLATNALIERTGAQVAVVLTHGFRDVLEIANERRYDQYDLSIEKPPVLVPRDRCYTVEERIGVNGEVIRPLAPDSVRALAGEIRANGAESIAIGLLHSYANDAHERAVGAALARALPDIPISLSSEVSPELREHDRVSTTVANAYVKPRIAGYLRDFANSLQDAGFDCPVLVMTSSGGMIDLDTAVRFPIRLVESGPSGGALLACRIAADAGIRRVVSFDMGGTTAKFCMIDDATPARARIFEVGRAARFTRGSGLAIRIPVIELIEIGAGGGSVAAVDSLGRLTVGPASVGAEPGPACYGRGGDRATVTDADALRGLLDPDCFAEGRMALDLESSRIAITRDIGLQLGLTAEGAADGVARIVDENMANAARIHSAERGAGIESRTLVAFGGNGPLHAAHIADKLRIDRIVIPVNPGVGSAVGFLTAPVSYEIVRSHHLLLAARRHSSQATVPVPPDGPRLAALNRLLAAMEADAEAIVRQAAPDGDLELTRTAFVRYRGQGHEVEVPVPPGVLTAADVTQLHLTYSQRYVRLYGRAIDDMDAEVLNWSVSVATASVTELPVSVTDVSQRSSSGTCRRLYDGRGGEFAEISSYSRAQLLPGQVVEGPALITEPSTTTHVTDAFTATLDAAANIIMTRRASECSSG